MQTYCRDLQKLFDIMSCYWKQNGKMPVTGITLDNMKRYPSDRCQNVTVDSNTTGKVIIETGAVLGSFLFLLYVNDVQNFHKCCRVFMFDDDTTVIISGKESGPLASQDVLMVIEWFSSCKLPIMSTNLKQCHLC